MCCPGCQAVAGMIAGSGMGRFYEQRTAFSEKPADNTTRDVARFRIYDDPELAAGFSHYDADGSRTVSLLVGGMTCAACTWLIENSLRKCPGVERANVNLARGRLDIRLSSQQTPVSRLPRPFCSPI